MWSSNRRLRVPCLLGVSQQRLCKALASTTKGNYVGPEVGNANNQQPKEQTLRGRRIKAVQDPVQKMVLLHKMLFEEMGCKLKTSKVSRDIAYTTQYSRVSDTTLPILLADARYYTVQELFNRACPAPNPCDGPSLTLSFVSTHFVDTHALGQPQSPRDGYALIQTLFKQHFARDAVRDSPAESPQSDCWIGQVVQPRLSCGISKRQARRWFECVGCG